MTNSRAVSAPDRTDAQRAAATVDAPDAEEASAQGSEEVSSTAFSRSTDRAVGVVFGLVAGSNLVQGIWIEKTPWLDLTATGFLLAIPASLLSLRHRIPLRGLLAIMLLLAALSLGYLEPALSANAEQKRTNLVLGVVLVSVSSFLCLFNLRRVKAFLITLILLALVVMAGQVLLPDALAVSTGRRTPLGLNAIGAGRAIGAAFIVVLAFALSARKPRHARSLYVLAMVLAVSVFAAGSRGPIVGVLAATLVLIFLHPHLRWSRKIVLLAPLSVATFVAYRESLAAGSRLTSLTTSGRQDLYTQAVRIAVENPAGVGWGNFFGYVPSGLLGSEPGQNFYAHNIILEFWAETGAVGGILFILFLLAVVVKSARRAKVSPVDLALTGLTVHLLVGAMLSSDVIGNRMMWVVCSAVLASILVRGRTPVKVRAPLTGPVRPHSAGARPQRRLSPQTHAGKPDADETTSSSSGRMAGPAAKASMSPQMRQLRSKRHRRWVPRWRVAGIGAACLVSLALALVAVVDPGRGSATPEQASTRVDPGRESATPTPEEEKAPQDLRRIVRTSDPLTISVLGDSTGNDPNEWVAVWAEHLGETHRVTMHRWQGERGGYNEARTLTYGTGGSSVAIWNMSEPGATASYPADKLPAGQPEKPDLVILSFGHNNDKTSVGSQLGQVRRSLNQQWHADVPTLVVLQNPGVNEHGARQRETLVAVARWAEKVSLPTIDVASAFDNAENRPSLMYDDIHPNRKGSRLWAKVVGKALG